MSKNMKKLTVAIPFTPEERIRVNAYIDRLGMKKGTFVRKLILEELARQDHAEQEGRA